LKEPLLAALQRLTDRGLHGVIFGGTLRDLMVNGPSTGLRDIDVVVDGASVVELERLFSDVVVRKTRFGGLNLNVGGWMVDIWPLSDTWALRELPITGRDFESLTRTTFLNVEAVTIDLAVRHRTRTVYAQGFFEAVRSRTLDINLEENPFPELAAIRALITASMLQYDLSRRLARYVIHYTNRTPLEQLVQIQFSHYGMVKYDRNVLHAWSVAIKDQIGTEPVIRVPLAEPVQQHLWGTAAYLPLPGPANAA
jgi:hypothetical protein